MSSTLRTSQKTYLIIQLSLVFTALIWLFFAPYAHNIIHKKQLRHTYLELIGDPATLSLVPDQMITSQQTQNKTFQTEWAKLPLWEKEEIQNIMTDLEAKLEKGFWKEALHEIYAWLLYAPLLEKIGLFLSLLLPILVLLDVEGARSTLFLLPLLALIYMGWILTIPKEPPSNYEKLFPTEQHLVTNYLKTPLSKDIFKQQEELKNGWELYLHDRYKGSFPQFFFTKDKFYALWLDGRTVPESPNHISLWLMLGYFMFTVCLCISLRASKSSKPRRFTWGKVS